MSTDGSHSSWFRELKRQFPNATWLDLDCGSRPQASEVTPKDKTETIPGKPQSVAATPGARMIRERTRRLRIIALQKAFSAAREAEVSARQRTRHAGSVHELAAGVQHIQHKRRRAWHPVRTLDALATWITVLLTMPLCPIWLLNDRSSVRARRKATVFLIVAGAIGVTGLLIHYLGPSSSHGAIGHA